MNTSTLIRTINIPSTPGYFPREFPENFWDPHPDSKKLLTESYFADGCVVGVHSIPKGLTAPQLFGQAFEIPDGTDVDFTRTKALNFEQMLYLVRHCMKKSAQLSLLLMQGIDGPQVGWFQKNGPKWVVYSYDADSGFEFPLPSELYVIQS